MLISPLLPSLSTNVVIGYKDSSADIAFNLRKAGIDVVTPITTPQPETEEDWSIPDSENGILDAVNQGANCIWANTILFSDHSLQTSQELEGRNISVVGQPPNLVQLYDDKFTSTVFFSKPTTSTFPNSKPFPLLT